MVGARTRFIVRSLRESHRWIGLTRWEHQTRMMANASIGKNVAMPPKKDEEEKKRSGMAIDLDPCQGTRDFFPDEMRVQRWLFDKFRATSEAFGFQEYDAPLVEKQELYKRKAGEEITQQMFSFTDKDGIEVTLRPEMTPSLARMILNIMRAGTGDIAGILPLKWYSVPQCWRFETTQRGRKREHYQWNMDIVGVNNVTCEVELLAAIVYFFESIGIQSSDIGIKVNSRKVLNSVLVKAGVPNELFAQTCVIIDKQDKIGAEECKKELMTALNLPKDVCDTVLQATTAKTLKQFAAVAGAEDSPEVEELQQLFDLAKDYGIGDWLVFDASVVRGLAYYTGVVFEGFDRAGVLRAVCGGGRYDRLLTLYGSKKEIPCIGFGFGDCVVMELLKEKGKIPSCPKTVDYVVAAYGKEMIGPSMSVAQRIRQSGNSVDLMQGECKKAHKMFSYADRVGAQRIAFVAPKEWDQNTIRIKDLRIVEEEDKEKDIPLDELSIPGRIDEYFRMSSGPGNQGSDFKASLDKTTDDFLALHPYLDGFTASRKDIAFFNSLSAGTSLTAFPNIARWFEHIASFPESQRNGW